jgi:hypothetical protein
LPPNQDSTTDARDLNATTFNQSVQRWQTHANRSGGGVSPDEDAHRVDRPHTYSFLLSTVHHHLCRFAKRYPQ